MDRIKYLLGKNRKTYNGLLLVIFTAILFFITFHKFETDKLELEIEDISPIDIRTKNLNTEISLEAEK